MRTTLANAKQSTIPEAVGFAGCDPRFLRLLNESQSRLANAGKWWGTFGTIRMCVTSGCITWPRRIRTILGMNVCGYGIPIRNAWYEFQTYRLAPKTGECTWDESQLLDRGLVCQHTDFTGLSKVRLFPTTSTDAGKRVLLQGKDANGAEIRTLDSVSGQWVNGEYVTLAMPFVESTKSFAAPGLTGAQKPNTNGDLTVVAVNVATGALTQIATWEPSEDNPAYRRSYLVNMPRMCREYEATSGCAPCRDGGDGCVGADESCTNIVVSAIAQLEYVPAVVDSDWLFISNLAALKNEMRAVQQEDRSEYAAAEQEHRRAIRQLQNELNSYSPATQTVVNVQSMGTAKLSRIFGGFT